MIMLLMVAAMPVLAEDSNSGTPSPTIVPIRQSQSSTILIYTDDYYHPAPNTYLDQALQALGKSYTAYYYPDFSGFETALTTEGPWDCVLFGHENSGALQSSTLDALNNYVNGGGRLIANCWLVSRYSTHPLWSTLGFTWVSDDRDPPDPVYWWDTAHPLFSGVPQFTSLTGGRYGIYGQYVQPLPGATALAGYTISASPNQAALILRNDGQTLFRGFMDGQNDADLDVDGTPDGVELWINSIEYVCQAQNPLWEQINEELDDLKGNVTAAPMPNIIKQRLIDKLEYAKELKDNAKIECEAGNFDAATKKLSVAKSQVESFASMVRITRRISEEDKESFLEKSAEIKWKIDTLIEYIETEHKC